jgi:hypothetical protein
VKLLINAKADKFAKDDNGNGLLYYALKYGKENAVEFIGSWLGYSKA